MGKPTREQIKEFWERCGIKSYPHTGHEDDYQYPNKHWGKQPIIDLNNLWKYAIPQLCKEYQNWHSLLYDWVDEWVDLGSDKDPALTLFWRIMKILSDEEIVQADIEL